MHNLIVTVVTKIDKIVVALIPDAVSMINTVAGIGIVKLPLTNARSKTVMLMIMNICNLALILVPQALLSIFMVTLMRGMQPIIIPKNVAILNGLLHLNNNKNMINKIILNLVQPDHDSVSALPWKNIPVVPLHLMHLKMMKARQVLPKIWQRALRKLKQTFTVLCALTTSSICASIIHHLMMNMAFSQLH